MWRVTIWVWLVRPAAPLLCKRTLRRAAPKAAPTDHAFASRKSWEDLGAPREAVRAVARRGFPAPTRCQALAYGAIAGGRDALVAAFVANRVFVVWNSGAVTTEGVVPE